MTRFSAGRMAALAAPALASLLPAAAAAAEKGMPQLHIPDFAPQLVWLAIWFAALYLLMAKLGLPRIAAAIAARQQRRESDLARAQVLRTEAEAASAAYQQALARARAQAQATIKETVDRMAAEAAERQRVVAAALTQQIAAAEQRIAASREQALAELHDVAADVGRAVVEKLTGAPPDPARMAAAVDRALARGAG
jgi:F-type H+-transporting ATPase subunit b